MNYVFVKVSRGHIFLKIERTRFSRYFIKR